MRAPCEGVKYTTGAYFTGMTQSPVGVRIVPVKYSVCDVIM